MRYANCGHPAALLVRADGSLEELSATGTVLGLFPEWRGALAQTRLGPADTLVICSDGVTEYAGADGTEFGLERLAALVRSAGGLGAQALLDRIAAELRTFGGPEPQDDVTLIVARRRPG